MEVAAAENEGKKRPAALPGRALVTMCALSVLFAWLAARAFRRPGAADEDAAFSFSTVVWRLSPLICSYLFFWTMTLSGARRTTAQAAAAVFMRASYLLLLADAAAWQVGPNAGAAVMFVATAYSAAASGRQRAGTERSADAAALSTPCYRSREEQKYERADICAFNFFTVFLVAAVFFVMLLDVCLGPEERMMTPGKANLGVLVFFTGPGLLVTWMFLLHGRPFDPDVLEACWMAILAGVFGWIVIALLVGVFFGEVAVMVFLWIVVMGLAGLLRYGQGVRARYEQLMAVKRSQPRKAQDASGLLVGRDREDTCYAHI